MRRYTGDILGIGDLHSLEQLREMGGAIDYVVGMLLTKVYSLAKHPDPSSSIA